MKKFIIFASALAILAMPAVAGATTKHHHKSHAKVAQGPAGLNGGNAAGPGFAPWAGPANGQNNPISGSPQDPAMQHRKLTPGQ
jgi:hypothetical protein